MTIIPSLKSYYFQLSTCNDKTGTFTDLPTIESTQLSLLYILLHKDHTNGYPTKIIGTSFNVDH